MPVGHLSRSHAPRSQKIAILILLLIRILGHKGTLIGPTRDLLQETDCKALMKRSRGERHRLEVATDS